MSTIRDLCSAQLMTTIYHKIPNTNHSFTILMYHSTYRLRGPLPQFARPASSSIIIVRGQRLLPSPMPLVQQQQEQEQWGWLWRRRGGGDRIVFIRDNAAPISHPLTMSPRPTLLPLPPIKQHCATSTASPTMSQWWGWSSPPQDDFFPPSRHTCRSLPRRLPPYLR